MGRLDRRTAAAERRGHIRPPVVEPEPVPAELWRSIHLSKQNHSAEHVRRVAREFIDFMAHWDYPGLQIIVVPVTRWWWPFPRKTRKAAWKLVIHQDDDAKSHRANTAAYKQVIVTAAVYLVATTGQLVYRESVRYNGGRARTTFQAWDGEFADQTVEMLDTIAQQHIRYYVEKKG